MAKRIGYRTAVNNLKKMNEDKTFPDLLEDLNLFTVLELSKTGIVSKSRAYRIFKRDLSEEEQIDLLKTELNFLELKALMQLVIERKERINSGENIYRPTLGRPVSEGRAESKAKEEARRKAAQAKKQRRELDRATQSDALKNLAAGAMNDEKGDE